MANFCPHCGEKLNDENSNFCPKCGKQTNNTDNLTTNNSTNTGMKCMYCGNEIPFGNMICTRCGKSINPAENEKHTGAIIAGYILSFIPIFSIIAFILGIYLLTRPNKNVHKHGIAIIILSILIGFLIFLFIISAASYHSRISSPYYYY